MAKPNIILVVSDQHNAGVLGCAGDSTVRTPNLDGLAERGVRFTNAYCNAPVCVPSRMSMLTSRYPSDLEIWTNGGLLNPYQPTFAHQLSIAGYETVLCGRMHFSGPNQHHGFQRRLVGDVSGAREDERRLFEGEIPRHTTGQKAPSVRDSGPGQTSYMAFDEAVTERAIEFLHDREDGDAERPFCLVVGYLSPHNPYVCPQERFDEYRNSVSLPENFRTEASDIHPAMRAWRKEREVDDLSREDHRRARAAYYGLVTYLDRQIGDLLTVLADCSFRDETAVGYVSDHGEMAGEHGIWWKESLYEGSVSVPMIWSWPDEFDESKTEERVTSLVDVAPTVLDVAEADALPGARGETLRPLLEANGSGNRQTDTVFSEMYPSGLTPARMIRTGRWKLVHYHGYDRPQLFDLRTDPDECQDLGAERRPVGERLHRQVLEGWSGDRVMRMADESEQSAAIIRDWHDQIERGESEMWRVPPDSNSFER